MSDLDELLAEIDDPDVAEKVKAKFTEQEGIMAKRQAIMDRDAKVAKEQAKLAQKFPRAMTAYQKGRLTLPDDPSDDALVAALKAKEEELEDLGVPIVGTAPSAPAPVVDEEDPAGVWGQDISSGRGDTTTQDLNRQIIELAETGDHGSRLDIIAKVAALNAEAQRTNDFSKIDALNAHFGAKYPVTKAPPATITNLTPIHGAGAAAVKAAAKRGRPPKAAAK